MFDYEAILQELGIRELVEETEDSFLSPVTGKKLASVRCTPEREYDAVVDAAEQAFRQWRSVPPGERDTPLILLEEQLLLKKEPLAWLITLETGKPLVEARGEVEAAAEYCQYAAGRAGESFSSVISSGGGVELLEQYHPLGPVGLITARNYPLLLWSWSALMAIACGNSVVWKPAPAAALSALALQRIIALVFGNAGVPQGLCGLVVDRDGALGRRMSGDSRLPLISFTGSRETGEEVARTVAGRLGRCNLELGGSNAAVVTPSANLSRAVPEIVRSATLTSGQRCTTLHRLIVHTSVFEEVESRLMQQYASLVIGDPFRQETFIGPLMDSQLAENFTAKIRGAQKAGARLLYGGGHAEKEGAGSSLYFKPALMEAAEHLPVLREEVFGPLLFLIRYDGDIRDAVRIVNDSPYGLAASVFTGDLGEEKFFFSPSGADCGMVYANRGTAGSAPGLAFGGEKASGGGRVSGSDSWKVYMRRQSGIVFGSI